MEALPRRRYDRGLVPSETVMLRVVTDVDPVRVGLDVGLRHCRFGPRSLRVSAMMLRLGMCAEEQRASEPLDSLGEREK